VGITAAVTASILFVTSSQHATRMASNGVFRAVRDNYWTIIGP